MRERWIRRISFTVVAAVLTLGMATPFVWMFLTAIKPPEEIFRSPAVWLPTEVRWENFREAWNAAPFGRFLVNSAVTSLLAAMLQIGTATGMAYAFARVRVPGKAWVYALVLGTMLVPEELRLVPNYLLADRLGWIDTYWALIVPPAAHAFPVLVLTVQMRSLPRDLFDAATIDGANHARLFRDVALPSCASIIAALFLIAFLGRWNDYLWPLVVTNVEHMRTLPVGLAYLRGSQEGGLQWQVLMSGACIVVAPVLLLFLVLQRRFKEGIIGGALKT